MFEPLGLSQQEELVYLAVLANPDACVARIEEIVGIPNGQVPALLGSLERKGLVSRTAATDAAFMPAPPRAALDGLAWQRKRAIDNSLAEAGELAKRLYKESVADPGDVIEMVHGSQALKQRARYALEHAHEEAMIFSRPPYIETQEESRALEIPDGVRKRYLYDRDAIDCPGHLDIIEADVRRGEEARFVPSLPMKLVLVDRSAGYIAFDLADPEVNAGFVVHRSSLLDSLLILFELLWERAIPLRFPPLPEEGDHTADDDMILALLATGLKDEAVARRLGISARSMRRRIAELQHGLGATSRFQAGVQAVRLNRIESATSEAPAS